jgi:hypothetical protein
MCFFAVAPTPLPHLLLLLPQLRRRWRQRGRRPPPPLSKMKMTAEVAWVMTSLSSFFSNFNGYKRGPQGEAACLGGEGEMVAGRFRGLGDGGASWARSRTWSQSSSHVLSHHGSVVGVSGGEEEDE